MKNTFLISLLFFVYLLLDSESGLASGGVPPDTVEQGYAIKNHVWIYNVPWEWKVEVPLYLLNYYQQKTRPQWTGDYNFYAKFIEQEDRSVQYAVKGLRASILDAKQRYNWTLEQEAMFVISFVQQMRYVPDSVLGYKDYEKYPVETLFDGGGDCEDKVILAAALLKALGMDVSMILLESSDKKHSHMALGIYFPQKTSGTGFVHEGKKYYYTETTFAGWKPGELPENWVDFQAKVIALK
jgi:hypothetical protein